MVTPLRGRMRQRRRPVGIPEQTFRSGPGFIVGQPSLPRSSVPHPGPGEDAPGTLAVLAQLEPQTYQVGGQHTRRFPGLPGFRTRPPQPAQKGPEL